MTVLDLVRAAFLVQTYAMGVAGFGVVLTAAGLFGIRRFRKANREVDLAREDFVRARIIADRNRLLDRDLMAVATEVDGKEFRP